MWLNDVEKAIVKLREEMPNFNFICVESIKPSADGGIVFKTTYHTFIKVYRNGVIEEKKEGEWRK